MHEAEEDPDQLIKKGRGSTFPEAPNHEENSQQHYLSIKENLKLVIAGAVAGAISRTATAPLDRLKVLFQAGNPSGGPQFMSLTQATKDIYKEGGFKAYYRGNATNVIKVAPETAIKFWVYENLKWRFSSDGTDTSNLSLTQRFAAGAIAGIVAQSCIYPLEVTKTRLALASSGQYSGIANCMTSLIRHEGPRSLYKGLVPALIGIVPYAGVDLGIYSTLKDSYQNSHGVKPGPLALLACGVVSSTCGQLVAYPLVVLRTRLQAQGMPGRPILYSGMFDCFWKIVGKEGYSALYRGLLPNFMKAIPAISISYVVYETTRDFLQDDDVADQT